MFPFCTDVTVVVIVNVSVRLLLTLLSAVTKPDIPSNGGVRKFVVSRSNLNKEGGGIESKQFQSYSRNDKTVLHLIGNSTA